MKLKTDFVRTFRIVFDDDAPPQRFVAAVDDGGRASDEPFESDVRADAATAISAVVHDGRRGHDMPVVWFRVLRFHGVFDFLQRDVKTIIIYMNMR